MTTLIRQHQRIVDVACWVWSLVDHTKQACSNKTMNQSWSPELHLMMFIYVYIFGGSKFLQTAVYKKIDIKEYSATLVITLPLQSIPGWSVCRCGKVFIFLTFLGEGLNEIVSQLKNITRNTIIFKSSLRLLSRSQVKIWLHICPAYRSASLLGFSSKCSHLEKR